MPITPKDAIQSLQEEDLRKEIAVHHLLREDYLALLIGMLVAPLKKRSVAINIATSELIPDILILKQILA